MTKEKEQALIEKYKYMFAEKDRSDKIFKQQIEIINKLATIKNSEPFDQAAFDKLRAEQDRIGSYYPIAFGFECNEGWYELLDDLMGKIQELDTEKQISVHQVKEKLGGLRFYVGSASDAIHDLISDAENKSYKICEVCGKPGKLCIANSWLKTVCKDHREFINWCDQKQSYKPTCNFQEEQEVIVNDMFLATVASTKFDEEKDTWKITMTDGGVFLQEELQHKPYHSLYVGWIVTHKAYPDIEFEVTEMNFSVQDGWLYNLVSYNDNNILTGEPIKLYNFKEDGLTTVKDPVKGYIKSKEKNE